jgi:hypothetical protein
MQENDKKTIVRDLPEWIGAKMMTVAGVLATAACYFAGYVSHKGYLSVFHLSVDAFPMDSAGYLVEGARAYGTVVLGLLMGNKDCWFGLVLCLACMLYAAYAWYLIRTVLGFPGSQCKDLTASFTRSFLSFVRSSVQIALGSTILAVVISVPGIVGAVSAMRVGSQSMGDFNKGCMQAEATCISLSVSGKAVAEGFRITQSKDRIAVYLGGVTHEYELAGKELATIAK